MKKTNLFLSLFSVLILIVSVFAQTKTLVKRTTYKTETVEFGQGGTISIVGAPVGSISVEGWQKPEVEITADIEVQGETEADLSQLAAVNTFVVSEATMGRVSIISVGTHDKEYMKRNAKKLSKKLLAMPFRIDYKIKVPVFSDLEINGNRGDFNLANVEGAMKINFMETNAGLKLSGGMVVATFGKGDVTIEMLTRSWRGQGADIQLAGGNLYLFLPLNFNGDIDASILRTGKIENSLTTLKPRDRTKFSEKLINAKSGNGGVKFNFTLGDGILKFAGSGK
jgi:phosphoribosylformylglycinamidine (FGAM) synthase PurS component